MTEEELCPAEAMMTVMMKSKVEDLTEEGLLKEFIRLRHPRAAMSDRFSTETATVSILIMIMTSEEMTATVVD